MLDASERQNFFFSHFIYFRRRARAASLSLRARTFISNSRTNTSTLERENSVVPFSIRGQKSDEARKRCFTISQRIKREREETERIIGIVFTPVRRLPNTGIVCYFTSRFENVWAKKNNINNQMCIGSR